LKLFAIGDQKVDVEVHVKEGEPPPLSKLELSAKIVYLIELAISRHWGSMDLIRKGT
jgi:hypothetical protein